MTAIEQAEKFYDLKGNHYDSVTDLADMIKDYARLQIEKDRAQVLEILTCGSTGLGKDGTLYKSIVNLPIQLD